MSRRSGRQTRRTQAVGLSGAAALLLVYIAGLFGLDVPVEVGAAAATLLAAGAAWITTERGDHAGQ